MDLFDYREKHGTAAVEKLATKCGSSITYLEHLTLYRKRPSTDLAHKLIAASKGELTLAELMLPSHRLAEKRASVKRRRGANLIAAANAAIAKAKATTNEKERRVHVKTAMKAARRASSTIAKG